MLRQGKNGNDILSILDALVSDNVSSFDYVESPMMEAALGIAVALPLQEIDF